jgi:hypothetical protein
MEQLGTDLAGAVSKTSTKKKAAGKMWDFNVEQPDNDREAINVEQERMDEHDVDNAEYNTRFGDKIAEVFTI